MVSELPLPTHSGRSLSTRRNSDLWVVSPYNASCCERIAEGGWRSQRHVHHLQPYLVCKLPRPACTASVQQGLQRFEAPRVEFMYDMPDPFNRQTEHDCNSRRRESLCRVQYYLCSPERYRIVCLPGSPGQPLSFLVENRSNVQLYHGRMCNREILRFL